MRRVVVHALVGGSLAVMLLAVAAGVGGYRHKVNADPYAIRRAALTATVATLMYGPIAGGLGAFVGAIIGEVRNGVDHHRACMAHRWKIDDD